MIRITTSAISRPRMVALVRLTAVVQAVAHRQHGARAGEIAMMQAATKNANQV
jgi:hypothetical protein